MLYIIVVRCEYVYNVKHEFVHKRFIFLYKLYRLGSTASLAQKGQQVGGKVVPLLMFVLTVNIFV